ncbi:alpha/beta hydrolase [Citrobacter portucalensis]|uniref:alpha/beta fold hydrolase n=1 Tax=Citrobacter portucalensis TaxID=1639133 RepID=UPI00339C2967
MTIHLRTFLLTAVAASVLAASAFAASAPTAPRAGAEETGQITSLRNGNIDLRLKHHIKKINGINMHYVEAGEGPLVVLVHGWPESWYSWRYQIPALVKAGFHVVVPDMRGYGQTEAPKDTKSYSLMRIVGDLVGLVHANNEEQAYLVGHDFGASATWLAAQLRPDMFPAIAALSVPFTARAPMPPLETLRNILGNKMHYWTYFQKEGVAEAEFERDTRGTFIRLFSHGKADPSGRPFLMNKSDGFLTFQSVPDELPKWLSEKDLEYITNEFRKTGFRGAFNWYRNIDQNWYDSAPLESAKIQQPALFIAGSDDPVIANPNGEASLAALPNLVPQVTQVIIPHGSHWIQQEHSQEVNQALAEYFTKVQQKLNRSEN